MTPKEWSARPDLVEEFSQILRNPTMQLAISVLEDVGTPRTRLKIDSPNLMENHALLNSKREGYFECLSNLRALAIMKQKGPDLDLSPWKHASQEQE
jgi:hypothetical protein